MVKETLCPGGVVGFKFLCRTCYLLRSWDSLAKVPYVWRWRRDGWKAQHRQGGLTWSQTLLLHMVRSVLNGFVNKHHSSMSGLTACDNPCPWQDRWPSGLSLVWTGCPSCSAQGCPSIWKLTLESPSHTCVTAFRGTGRVSLGPQTSFV